MRSLGRVNATTIPMRSLGYHWEGTFCLEHLLEASVSKVIHRYSIDPHPRNNKYIIVSIKEKRGRTSRRVPYPDSISVGSRKTGK